MKKTSELLNRIEEYEKYGFSRSQAIELVKVERLIVLNNQIKGIKEIMDANRIDTLLE